MSERRTIEKATAQCIDLCKETIDPLRWALSISDIEIASFIEDKVIPPFVSDVCRYASSDPAKHGSVELAFDTTCCKAVMYYRLAHAMLEWELLGGLERRRGFAFKVYEEAKRETGIDIHPGAEIGPGFVIDHGVGTQIGGRINSGSVIGETCIIGRNVTILNGATLGAREVNTGEAYRRRRHPIVGNNVTICGNAQILGGIEIGNNSFIGPGCIITSDIPPDTKCTWTSVMQMTKNGERESPIVHAVVVENKHLVLFGENIGHCQVSMVNEKRMNCVGYGINIVERHPDKIVFDVLIWLDSINEDNILKYVCVTLGNESSVITTVPLRKYLSVYYKMIAR